jgi:hypothetical protein
MDVEGFGSTGEGGSGGQGVDYALLDRGKKRCIGVRSHFDDESSMRFCGGRGISGGVLFVFRELWGCVDL